MTEAVVIARQFDDPLQQRTASDLGMWVFLATEILFFGALFVAYTATRVHDPQAFAIASRLTNLTLGSINTGVLLTSSLMMALVARRLHTCWPRRPSARYSSASSSPSTTSTGVTISCR